VKAELIERLLIYFGWDGLFPFIYLDRAVQLEGFRLAEERVDGGLAHDRNRLSPIAPETKGGINGRDPKAR
jgi:hypothetical protein